VRTLHAQPAWPAAGPLAPLRPVRGMPLPAAPPPKTGPGTGAAWSALAVLSALLVLMLLVTSGNALAAVADGAGGGGAGAGSPGTGVERVRLYFSVATVAAGVVALLVGATIQLAVGSAGSRLAMPAVPLAVMVTVLAGWGGWEFLQSTTQRGDVRTPVLLAAGATGFAVWAFRRTQRNQRLPWWLILLGLGWGCTAALPLPLVLGTVLREHVLATVVPGVTRVILTSGFSAAVFEEVSKGLGVLLAYLLFRRYLSTMLSGIVMGAMSGLGFNFAESILYMTGDTGRLTFQFWHRQAVGLPLGHLALTAIIGAGIGLAAQQRRLAARVACVATGLILAIAGHALWNVGVSQGLKWESDNPVANLLLWIPLTLLVYKGPLLAIVMVLVILGLRTETAALVTELRRETATGLGAVRPEEVALLATPHRRFLARVQALCDHGFRARRLVAALHRSQIELALVRWPRACGTVPEPPGTEAALRLRIGMLRRQLFNPGMARPR
jgi:protease PrsW